MDSQLGQMRLCKSHVYSRPLLTSERPRGHSVLAYYNRYECGRCAPSQLGWLTDRRRGPRTVGINSPWCQTPKTSRDLVWISEVLRETVLARNFYQSESRWFDIWEPASTEFYFRLHRRRTNVYFIKIRAWHNIIFILRTIQDQGRKVCIV